MFLDSLPFVDADMKLPLYVSSTLEIAMFFNGVVVVLDALDTVEWWHIIAGALNIIVAFAIWIWIGLDDREAK